MFIRSSKQITILLISAAMTIGVTATFVQAQEHTFPDAHHTCDVEVLAQEQQEHALVLEHFDEQMQIHPEAALEALYSIGMAYQTLAIECGFTLIEGTEEPHNTGSEAEEPGHEAFVGDPENGEVLFNAVVPQTGFACATCHLTETTDRLIGPGLEGIGAIGHDPSEHDVSTHEAATEETTETAHGTDHGAAAEATQAAHGEGHGTSDHDETSDVSTEMDEVIEYIRTSILHPSDFVVPTYPDNVMPQTYGEIYTHEEINDLIAYLLTLD